MLLQELREQVSEYGKRMLRDGLTRGTGGYIAARDPATGYIASSPSGVDYMKIDPERVLVTEPDGTIIEGEGAVSSEFLVVREVFKNRADIHGLVHSHSRFATVLASMRLELPAVCFTLPYAAGGENVRCTGYHSFYSMDLARDILSKLEGRKAVLMGNHGLLSAGASLKEAYQSAAEVEFCAEVYWRARCIGEPVILSSNEVETALKDSGRYAGAGEDAEL